MTELLSELSLLAKAVPYRYRYCPRCCHEWPAIQTSCPQCVHWLGDRPLQRTEWQLSPRRARCSTPEHYELIVASALMIRVVAAQSPNENQLAQTTNAITDFLALEQGRAVCEVPGHGWLVWTTEGARHALRQGLEIERGLIQALPRLERAFSYAAKVRWGIWIDQYALPCDQSGHPVIPEVTAEAIFNFEPDDMFSSSEEIYRATRRWEQFICVPRRLMDGKNEFGFCMMGHKRPSAFDQAQTQQASPFVGREPELSIIDACRKASGRMKKLTIVAKAGSGKTRLLKEWLKQHPELRIVTATFSLFGGTVDNFASQLASLPTHPLNCQDLTEAVMTKIEKEKIEVLVLDDIHWAGDDGATFLRSLISALSSKIILVILASRPNGRTLLRKLQPTAEITLKPLKTSAVKNMARRLICSTPAATEAVLRSKGNPLFVEQFAAWSAETGFKGGKTGPRTLYEVIAARISHLSKVRLAEIRERLRWGQSWQRITIDSDLEKLETEIGLWLDRLETGDYADRAEAARHLAKLEHIDYEIFILSALAGRSRPRSNRLREAIERLLLGSAEQIFDDLKRRAVRASAASKENILREARRAGDILFEAFDWRAALKFYEFSGTLDPSRRTNQFDFRLAECRRRSRKTLKNNDEIEAALAQTSLDTNPRVTALGLPNVWAELGRAHRCGRYFVRAAQAAEAINDGAMVAWAMRKAREMDAVWKSSSEPIDEAIGKT